ncbi:MAG: TadE family protein [Planctomycetota bacterium]
MSTRPHPTRRTARLRRNRRGAVMVETVLITPLLMIVIVLLMYLGWNFRRLQRVTNMDRYEVWRETTPGSTGPGKADVLGHEPLNQAFYSDISDPARTLTQSRGRGRTAIPEAHRTLQQQTADEGFAYLESFLGSSPTGIYERFEARHDQVSPFLATFMSDTSSTRTGHRRLNGDWRYANGVAFNGQKQKWEPASYRVAPGPALREVFFVELDEGLSPYTRNNRLAQAIQDFYTAYPSYRGPDIPTTWDPSSGWTY